VFAFGGTADSATPHNITGSETVQATISGFTVDGNNRVPTGRSAGILLRNVEGTISNNTVRNMYFGEQETFGIVAYGNSNITIKGNNVSEYSRVGIGVNGDLGNLDDPYAVITDNRVTGKGPTDTIVQNGIQIGFGASGLVTGNTVSNNFWTGKYEGEGTNDPATDIEADGAAGILLYMPGNDSIEVSGNTLTANQFGVWTVAATKVDIHNNTITGTDHTEYGYPTGIAIWSADQWTDDFGGSEIGTTGTINNNTITTNDYGLLIRDYNITVGAPAPSITEFNSNTFNNNLYNLDNHSINNIDARNNTWSVSGQNDLDQIEAKINHYCSGSTYVHGTCSITDDYGTGFGMVQYEDIEVPTNSGWNIQSKSATPNETPLDVTCGGYSKENSVAQNWTAVSGENIKYQRKVTYPNGSIGYFNAGGNNYTPFATFGGNPGVEGLWKTRVRTYVDANGNNAPDIGEETSDWSNECNITFDKTAPSAPINGAPNNVSIPTNNFDFTWDASSDAFPVTYEFQSTLNPTESEGVLTTGLWKSGTLSSNMIHSSGASDGKWYWQVRATDLAGNTSAWSSIWNVTLDQIPPSAPTLVSPSHSAIVKGSPTQSWSSTDNDIDHYVYESWKTQETTDPANLIYSNDTLTTTSRTVGGTQNITFWWRVRAVDRAGNESDWSEMRKLIVDNTKPSIEIVSPDENSAHNATFNILVKAEDSGGIGQFVVNIYDGNGKFLSPCVNKSGGGATEYTVTCSIDTTEYTDGTYGIRTNARDLAGNMSNTLSRVFIFDNTFPNIVDTKMYVEREGAWEEDYLAKSGDKVKVSIEVEDALTEVDKVEIWVRENPWDPNHNELVYGYMTKDEDDPTHFEFTYTVPDTYKNGDLINQFFEGNYFNFKPYDILGNSYIGWRKNFTIDNTPPEPPELTGDPIQYVKWGDVTRSWLPSSSPDVDYYMYENITNGWTAGPYYSGQNGYDITHTTGNYDRVFEWRVAAVDYAGNKTWSNEIYEVVVDNTPPANPSLSSPANNLVTRGDVLKNEWSAVDGAYKYIYESYHDEEAQNPRWHEEFDTTSKTAYNVKDATFWWRVKAVDLAGNESGWSYLWKVTVDNTAPVVEITNPSDTDILSGTVDITGYITDKNLSYYNIAIYKGGDNVHDSSLRIEEYTEYTSEFSDKTLHTWDTTNDKFPDGVYQIRLVAEDLAGNGESEGDSEHVISVTVDNTPPVTTLNEEISGIFTNDPIVIEGNTIDNLSGVDFVNLYYNLSSNLVENWILITTVDNPDNDSPFDDWKYTWTPPQEGTYDIKASATDTLGNEEQSAYIYDITYDTTPPEKVIITADQMLGILRDVTASDSLSGVQKIEISPDNINWVPYVLGTDVNLNDLVGNRPGTYKVYIRVTDNAGNTKTETVIFTIPSGETLGLTTKDKDKSPLKPTPVQAYGIGGYPLLSQTDLLDTEEQQTPEEKTITEDTTAVKGEEDINGEPTSEEETTKWWIYPLVILPLLAIFLILWKRRKRR